MATSGTATPCLIGETIFIMNHVAFYTALAGGILIGSAATLLLLANGKIAGISNILGKLPFTQRGDRLWRVLFLIGLIGGAAAYNLFSGDAPIVRAHFPAWLLAIAGLLVGFGTSMSNGCTSGHGVCGLGRLSLRSLAATMVFLVVGIVTAIVTRHVFGVF